ncbi:MAG: hypothetical protein A2X94_07160 [Bdellovibrionales bacterium GWB1_55_8]|nr:MAG: hypothetical protein A2X94_07160 [Bdellovibrionales bacterium GWB1_55_8]
MKVSFVRRNGFGGKAAIMNKARDQKVLIGTAILGVLIALAVSYVSRRAIDAQKQPDVQNTSTNSGAH